MTDAAALAAVEEIAARGGDADVVLLQVLAALDGHGLRHAVIRFVKAGRLVDGPRSGERIGELTLATDDAEFAEQVAAAISPYVLVGWDTSGEPWEP